MLCRISKSETCLGGWLAQVRLAINVLLVKRRVGGWLGQLRGNHNPQC